MTMTFALRSPAQALARALELRIDVSPEVAEVEHELGALHDRMRRPGDRLHAMPDMPSGLPACACAIAKPTARFSCTWKTWPAANWLAIQCSTG